MLRSISEGLLAVVAVAAVATIPAACQSGGVGDPCTPEEESQSSFGGFDISEEYIESRSFQCATRICLVNHFQGRVSCPLGQSASDILPCSGPQDTSCPEGEKCVASQPFAQACVTCDPAMGSGCVPLPCPAGLTCDATLGVCTCDSTNSPTFMLEGVSYACSYLDASCVPGSGTPCTGVLQSYTCHTPDACQQAGGTSAENKGKACCIPGTDTPIGVPVCGQCGSSGSRDAADAVYCSCRCAVADGAPAEPEFNFCSCPTGFTCSEIRPDITLGGSGQELTGKYCIKVGSAYDGSAASCGVVAGNDDSPCAGVGGE